MIALQLPTVATRGSGERGSYPSVVVNVDHTVRARSKAALYEGVVFSEMSIVEGSPEDAIH